MFKRQGGDGVAALDVPANPGKADDRADIGTRMRQRRDFPPNIEIGFLNADGHGGGHGRDASNGSAAGHRRKKCDFARPRDP